MPGAPLLVLVFTFWLALLVGGARGDLRSNFYRRSCPGVEGFIRDRVAEAVNDDPGLAAKLLRLHFHDCFVQGCDASILLDPTDFDPAEKDADINLTVGGYEFIDFLKGEIERECEGVVSCADIVALAAREAVRAVGGPSIPLRTGRRDGFTSENPDANTLPTFNGGVRGLLNTFGNVGLNRVDMVALSGAHTIGVGSCLNVQGRIPPFEPDGLLEPRFLRNLSRSCIRNRRLQERRKIPLDFKTPQRFDNQYYKNLLDGKGTFITDSLLSEDDRTRRLVVQWANSKTAFFRQFTISFQKMSETDLLTGRDGEIRRNCRVIND